MEMEMERERVVESGDELMMMALAAGSRHDSSCVQPHDGGERDVVLGQRELQPSLA
jgi:hypothetical protein